MEAVVAKKQKVLYILIAFVIFFTTSDLIAGFSNQLILASIFSVLSGAFVFYGTFVAKSIQIEKKVDKTIDFVKSNFNKWSIVLSALDIICTIIAIFTVSVAISMVLCLVFRVAFVGRITTTIYKFKTVVRVIIATAFIYLFKRSRTMKITKTQWIALVAGILGIAFGIVSYYIPQIQIAGETLWNVVIASGVSVPSIVVATFKNSRALTEEEISKQKAKEAEKVLAEAQKCEKQKAKEVAKAEKRLEELKKAEELVAQYKSEQAQKASVSTEEVKPQE